MRRGVFLSSAVIAFLGHAVGAAFASPGVRNPDHPEPPVVEDVGYQDTYEDGGMRVQLHASELAASRIRSQGGTCTYPERWKADVEAYDDRSKYYPMIADLYDEATKTWHPDENGIDRFGDHDWEVTHDSCVQIIYEGSGSCTGVERIGVRALAMRYDTRVHATVGNLLEFGVDQTPETVCVEIVTQAEWHGLIDGSHEIPDPIRATFPQYRTLVGLENSVWYQVDADQDRYHDSFTVHLPTPGGRDWVADVQAWLEELAIDVDGDGVWEHTVTCSTEGAESVVDCGGSLEDPLYSFMYEYRGVHAFTIEARWAGFAVGPTGEIHDLDPEYLTRQYTFDWETVEVRSSLDG